MLYFNVNIHHYKLLTWKTSEKLQETQKSHRLSEMNVTSWFSREHSRNPQYSFIPVNMLWLVVYHRIFFLTEYGRCLIQDFYGMQQSAEPCPIHFQCSIGGAPQNLATSQSKNETIASQRNMRKNNCVISL